MPLATPYRIEPRFPSALPTELVDVIAELTRVSAVLGQCLHKATAASLAELVRVMNCAYSNLIAGHNTRPHARRDHGAQRAQHGTVRNATSRARRRGDGTAAT